MMKHACHKAGFTLIEMIVSLALFSVVMTVSVGALLMLVAANDQLQGEQSVMTNISFALDAITREIRTGTFYYCVSADTDSLLGVSEVFNDSFDLDALGDRESSCVNGNSTGLRYTGIAFKEAGDSITGSAERILYYYDDEDMQIYRRVGDGDKQPLISSGIDVVDAEFFVDGTQNLYDDGDATQPTVTIFIEAVDVNDSDSQSHHIQTTITQRTLDI